MVPDIRFLFDPRIHGRVRRSGMNSVLKQRISGASAAYRELHEAIKAKLVSLQERTVRISRKFLTGPRKKCVVHVH